MCLWEKRARNENLCKIYHWYFDEKCEREVIVCNESNQHQIRNVIDGNKNHNNTVDAFNIIMFYWTEMLSPRLNCLRIICMYVFINTFICLKATKKQIRSRLKSAVSHSILSEKFIRNVCTNPSANCEGIECVMEMGQFFAPTFYGWTTSNLPSRILFSL